MDGVPVNRLFSPSYGKEEESGLAIIYARLKP